MKIIYTSKFERAYKKLPPNIKAAVKEKLEIFRSNPHDQQLKTHKLHGKFSEFWSFSITHAYRIIFEFGQDETVYFHDTNDHTVYQ